MLPIIHITKWTITDHVELGTTELFYYGLLIPNVAHSICFFLWLIKQFQNSLGFSASYVNFDFSDFLGIKSFSKSVEKLSLKQEFRWRRPVL